jgi:hypothetical protein
VSGAGVFVGVFAGWSDDGVFTGVLDGGCEAGDEVMSTGVDAGGGGVGELTVGEDSVRDGEGVSGWADVLAAVGVGEGEGWSDEGATEDMVGVGLEDGGLALDGESALEGEGAGGEDSTRDDVLAVPLLAIATAD